MLSSVCHKEAREQWGDLMERHAFFKVFCAGVVIASVVTPAEALTSIVPSPRLTVSYV